MNEDIIKQIALELNIRVEQVKSTLKMLEDGNTIPFIARYRKEVTGNLDEEQIRGILGTKQRSAKIDNESKSRDDDMELW